jgi:hypothetical protein
MATRLDEVKHAAFVIGVSVATCFLVGLWINGNSTPPEEESAQVRAKLTAAGFQKVTLRTPMADRDACGEFSRRFAALDRSGDVVMGIVCCVKEQCEVLKY